MTNTVSGITVPEFMQDFDKEYYPHKEWLLLCAYTYNTNFKDAAAAVDQCPFAKKDKQMTKALCYALSLYNNRVDHYLTWDYEISKSQSDAAFDRICAHYAGMIQYYTKLSMRLEEFYDGGFFDNFTFIFTDAAREFAKLVFDDNSMKSIDFADHLIIDYLKKYNLPGPKWKASVADIPYDADGTKAIVVGDLLQYHFKTTHAFWENESADPRKSTPRGLACSHTDFIWTSGGIMLCEICDGDILFGSMI